jgi:hypothetical protein
MFKNWSDAIDALPEEYQLETYKAVSKYGLTGEMPSDISPIAKAILISFSREWKTTLQDITQVLKMARRWQTSKRKTRGKPTT